ncbi:MAG: hypothetical protein AAF590_04270 [Pseudomonadota bacterium]
MAKQTTSNSRSRPSRKRRSGRRKRSEKARDGDMAVITALFDDFAKNLAKSLAGQSSAAPQSASARVSRQEQRS